MQLTCRDRSQCRRGCKVYQTHRPDRELISSCFLTPTVRRFATLDKLANIPAVEY